MSNIYLSSSDGYGPPENLYHLLRVFGYAHIKNIVPIDVLDSLLDKIKVILGQRGLLSHNANSAIHIKHGLTLKKGDEIFEEIFHDIYKIPEVHMLPHVDSIKNLISAIYREEALALPAHMIRLLFPDDRSGYSIATPYHQDYPGSQGSERALTVWCPLESYEPISGTLAFASKRHREGIFDVGISDRNIFEITENYSSDEVIGAVNKGDILLFTAFTPHRSLPNKSSRLRISIDFRFQPISDPVSNMFVSDWNPIANCSWDDIYKRSGDLPENIKYYWRGRFNKIYAHNNIYLERELRTAIESANQGNVEAYSVLRCALDGDGVPYSLKRRARSALKFIMRSQTAKYNY